jgi:hypothetical protein
MSPYEWNILEWAITHFTDRHCSLKWPLKLNVVGNLSSLVMEKILKLGQQNACEMDVLNAF